jgi:hypothetical protein
MRRLVVLAGLASVACLGFGAAFVLAGNSKPESTDVTFCHAAPGNPENLQALTRMADQIFGNSGHVEDPYDIIPVFTYTTDGTTTTYEGKNLTITDGWGAPGGDVLINGCLIATTGTTTETTGSTTETTETTVTTGTSETVTTITTTVPTTITVPGETVTVPPETTTSVSTVTVTAPATTVTLPGSTTVVTVPSGSTTTVTLPVQTVTVPPQTVTVSGEEIIRPPETTTLAAVTETVTAGASTTVVTETAPNTIVENGVLARKTITETVTAPARTVSRPAHLVRTLGDHRLAERNVVHRVIRTKVIVIVIHVHGCPPGTVVSNGNCTHTSLGKG